MFQNLSRLIFIIRNQDLQQTQKRKKEEDATGNRLKENVPDQQQKLENPNLIIALINEKKYSNFTKGQKSMQ
jgi:hypothetical protein